MTILPIYLHPHPVLRETAVPVTKVDKDIKTLMENMLQTMHAAPGVGLAANQVGITKRVIVTDCNSERENSEPNPLHFANPEIIWKSKETAECQEGCLSIPTMYEDVTRPAKIKVKALDINNEPFEIEAEGLLGACIQHEIDHLDGIEFIDHLSRLKRAMMWKKFAKFLPEITPDIKYPIKQV